MSALDSEALQLCEDIVALCRLSAANFPSDCKIIIGTEGAKASGRLVVNTYQLQSIIEVALSKAPGAPHA